MGWILTSKCDGHEGVHWDITAGPVVLGHRAGRDIVVNDPRVDQQHCKLYTRAGRVYIESIGPGEHVHVNGAPVRAAALAPGDTIALGGARFTVTRNASANNNDTADPHRSTDHGPRSTAPLTLADEAAAYATAIQNTARNQRSTVNCQLSTAELPLLGDSRAMREARALIHQIAPTHLGVLITGETGTGKELAAEMLHAASRRAGGSLIAVNCAAIPENLFESEIFGHEKGAFTGADRKRRGKFELAHQGTLFLDEIGELSPENQARLLRVLERGAYHPVGAEKESHADVRILAATNRDLQQAIHQGRFRQDLYYRLGAVEITLPPLRMRPSDIPLLAQHFAGEFDPGPGGERPSLTDDALAYLQALPWAGNVRELRNAIERATALAKAPQITPRDFTFLDSRAEDGPGDDHPDANNGPHLQTLVECEHQHITRVLQHCNYNVSQAARILGVHRNTLHNKIAAYGIGG